jgi:hypothetical protein
MSFGAGSRGHEQGKHHCVGAMGQCKVCRWLWSEMNTANTAWLLSDDNKANFGDVFTRCCLWRVLVFVFVVVVVLAVELVVLVLVLVLLVVAVVEVALVVMMVVVVMVVVVDSLPRRRISDSALC